jgi:hypothetical protein
MSLLEIEAAIKKLPKEKLNEFDQWYQDFCDEQWDEQIRRDVRSGKLQGLRSEVHRAEAARTLRPFP